MAAATGGSGWGAPRPSLLGNPAAHKGQARANFVPGSRNYADSLDLQPCSDQSFLSPGSRQVGRGLSNITLAHLHPVPITPWPKTLGWVRGMAGLFGEPLNFGQHVIDKLKFGGPNSKLGLQAFSAPTTHSPTATTVLWSVARAEGGFLKSNEGCALAAHCSHLSPLRLPILARHAGTLHIARTPRGHLRARLPMSVSAVALHARHPSRTCHARIYSLSESAWPPSPGRPRDGLRQVNRLSLIHI